MMYDTEYSLSLYSMMGGTYSEDTLSIAMYGKSSNMPNWGGGWMPVGPGGQQQPQQPQQKEPEEHTVLFYKLLQNDEFKQRFVTTFSDLMNKNLSQENMLTRLDEFKKMYEPVIEEHMRRVSTSSNFNSEVSNIRTFIQNREKYIYNFFKSDLSLSGQTADINLAVNDAQGGALVVNTITADMKDNKWSGTYCTDYPVTITAVPAEGYVFDGWEGAEGEGESITVTPGQAQQITARFTKQ
jgi:uncharacterized repeat protein (TIGR02543 family)